MRTTGLKRFRSAEEVELAPRFTLRDREIHVWSARLDLPDPTLRRLSETLSRDELARASRFRFNRDRRAFIASRGILRMLLGRYLQEIPERIRFEYTGYGKPSLAGNPARTRLRFNVSHSGAVAVFALQQDFEVGVDVEQIRSLPDLEAIAERFFSKEEVAALLRHPIAGREEAFYRCWTAKEAYIKGVGEGLSMPLDRFAVSLGPREGRVGLRILENSPGAAVWTVRRFQPCPGYVAAVAVPRDRFRVLHRWWRERKPSSAAPPG